MELPARIARPDVPLVKLLGALHAAEQGQIALLPRRAIRDRWDSGGLFHEPPPQTGGPTTLISDGHPGGIGITWREHREFGWLVGGCACERGCPVVRAMAPDATTSDVPPWRVGALERMGGMLP
jgi:DEAD/DEAH box helicase domain-containing protein